MPSEKGPVHLNDPCFELSKQTVEGHDISANRGHPERAKTAKLHNSHHHASLDHYRVWDKSDSLGRWSIGICKGPIRVRHSCTPLCNALHFAILWAPNKLHSCLRALDTREAEAVLGLETSASSTHSGKQVVQRRRGGGGGVTECLGHDVRREILLGPQRRLLLDLVAVVPCKLSHLPTQPEVSGVVRHVDPEGAAGERPPVCWVLALVERALRLPLDSLRDDERFYGVACGVFEAVETQAELVSAFE